MSTLIYFNFEVFSFILIVENKHALALLSCFSNGISLDEVLRTACLSLHSVRVKYLRTVKIRSYWNW